MIKIFLVGTGGFLGAVLRYTISGHVQRLTQSIGFPYGTLAVNIAGCLLIGMLTRMDELRQVFSSETRLLLFMGVLGAFTTFSTFSNETINLINDKRFFFAFLNVGIHVVLGLLAVLLGRLLITLFWK